MSSNFHPQLWLKTFYFNEIFFLCPQKSMLPSSTTLASPNPVPFPEIAPAAAAAKSLQSCPTLCDPMNCSPPGSSILGFSRQEFWSGVPLPSRPAPNSLKEDSFCGTDMRTFLNMAAPPVKFCTSHVPAAKRRRTCLDLVRLTWRTPVSRRDGLEHAHSPLQR